MAEAVSLVFLLVVLEDWGQILDQSVWRWLLWKQDVRGTQKQRRRKKWREPALVSSP